MELFIYFCTFVFSIATCKLHPMQLCSWRCSVPLTLPPSFTVRGGGQRADAMIIEVQKSLDFSYQGILHSYFFKRTSHILT